MAVAGREARRQSPGPRDQRSARPTSSRAQAVLPSLVIADVVMPGIDGNQLYEEIQKRWPEMPMLFISGYTYSDTVSRGLIGERCEFLQKPMEPEQLARTVRRLLQARQRAPS